MTCSSFPMTLKGHSLLKIRSLLSTRIAKILINNYRLTLQFAEKVKSSFIFRFLRRNRKTLFIKYNKQFLVIKLLFFIVYYVIASDQFDGKP